jgi:hypothetical protein
LILDGPGNWSDNVEGLDFTMDTIVLFDEARVSG